MHDTQVYDAQGCGYNQFQPAQSFPLEADLSRLVFGTDCSANGDCSQNSDYVDVSNAPFDARFNRMMNRNLDPRFYHSGQVQLLQPSYDMSQRTPCVTQNCNMNDALANGGFNQSQLRREDIVRLIMAANGSYAPGNNPAVWNNPQFAMYQPGRVPPSQVQGYDIARMLIDPSYVDERGMCASDYPSCSTSRQQGMWIPPNQQWNQAQYWNSNQQWNQGQQWNQNQQWNQWNNQNGQWNQNQGGFWTPDGQWVSNSQWNQFQQWNQMNQWQNQNGQWNQGGFYTPDGQWVSNQQQQWNAYDQWNNGSCNQNWNRNRSYQPGPFGMGGCGGGRDNNFQQFARIAMMLAMSRGNGFRGGFYPGGGGGFYPGGGGFYPGGGGYMNGLNIGIGGFNFGIGGNSFMNGGGFNRFPGGGGCNSFNNYNRYNNFNRYAGGGRGGVQVGNFRIRF